jgi:hypothetical protein
MESGVRVIVYQELKALLLHLAHSSLSSGSRGMADFKHHGPLAVYQVWSMHAQVDVA